MNTALRLAIAVVLLAGCSVAPLTPTTEVGTDRGVVVLRLATNAAPAGFFARYDKVHLVSDTGIFELSRSTVGVVRTGVFTGALAPGRYHVSEFQTVGQNFVRSVNVPRAFGTFTVQAGHLTDLGTLIYQPAGGSRVLFARTRREDDTRELVAATFPRVADTVLQRPILDWDENPEAAESAKIAAAVRAAVAPFNAPVVAPSGAVYAGSALGQVLARSDEGRWTLLNTGTSREILTVFEDGEALIAGGEEAFLARSIDRGRSWQRMPAPDRGAILHLTRRPNGGLLAVSLLDRAVTVWESTGTAWKLHNQIPYEGSFNVGALPPHVVSSATRLYVGMPNGTVHGFDLGSGQWQRHDASFSLIALALAGDVLYAYGAQFTHSMWTSEDGGKTWRDLGTSRRAGAPVFTDPRTGYVLYVKELYGSAISVQMTKDGGRTWTEFGVLPEAAARRVLLYRPGLVHPSGTLFVFGTNGAVWATRDLGTTWTEERRGGF